MRLQSISQETSQTIWNSRRSGAALPTFNVENLGDYEEQLSDLELWDIKEKLEEVKDLYSGKNLKIHGGKVDSDIVEIIHGGLLEHAGVGELSNIGFWRWLSNVASDGYFWDFINWRFDSSDKVINWGVTGAVNFKEVYFARAWLRGHKMIDPSLEDPYKYAKKGASDIWRSQILRQDFGQDREFVKAFLDTVYDDSGKTIIASKELRKQLIPEIRIWTSTASFAHLTYEENLQLLASFRNRGK